MFKYNYPVYKIDLTKENLEKCLRTIPVMLDICQDIERYCPDAILLNYTNPMAMLCRAMQRKTHVKVTGLCHS